MGDDVERFLSMLQETFGVDPDQFTEAVAELEAIEEIAPDGAFMLNALLQDMYPNLRSFNQ